MMGTVVQFRKTKQSSERSELSSQCRDYLLALVENLQAIENYRSAIEKNVHVVQSIMLSTENPELRARLSEQLKAMRDQLLLVSLSLLSAKQSMEKGLMPPQN